jgi:urease accessory protein
VTFLASAPVGLWDGFLHPVLGLDHLFAMVCVGVVSALLGKTAVWSVPASFVLAMAVGGLAGLNGAVVPHGERLIAASLIALGLIIAMSALLPRQGLASFWTATAFVAIFGAAHGNAHGLEIPATASPAAFTAGFLFGTAGLHLTGVFLGLWANRQRWTAAALKLGGLFTAALGVGLLTR